MPPTTKPTFKDALGIPEGTYIGEVGLTSGRELRSVRLMAVNDTPAGPVLLFVEDGGERRYLAPWAGITFISSTAGG